uniref:Uncharacterized protein n=1 Tax=Ascaris lumbricoides TaxID=6252 RepID=A0A0M3HM89_ASCLU
MRDNNDYNHKKDFITWQTFHAHQGPICLKTDSVLLIASINGFLGSTSNSG